MYRVVCISGKWYALWVESIDDDRENIDVFVEEGTPVVLVQDLEDLFTLGIYPEIIEDEEV